MDAEQDDHAAAHTPPAPIRLPPGLNVKPAVPVYQPFNMFASQQVSIDNKLLRDLKLWQHLLHRCMSAGPRASWATCWLCNMAAKVQLAMINAHSAGHHCQITCTSAHITCVTCVTCYTHAPHVEPLWCRLFLPGQQQHGDLMLQPCP